MASSNPRFGTGSNNLEGMVQAVKEKAEGVTGALSDTAAAVKQNVGQLASSAGDTAEKAWTSSKMAAEEFGSEIAQRAESIQNDVVSFIRRNPLTVVLGALGVGALLGAALCAGSRGRA